MRANWTRRSYLHSLMRRNESDAPSQTGCCPLDEVIVDGIATKAFLKVYSAAMTAGQQAEKYGMLAGTDFLLLRMASGLALMEEFWRSERGYQTWRGPWIGAEKGWLA